MAEAFIGQIMQVAFNFAPVDWAVAAGQTFNVTQNQALFALIGGTFGGDGRTTFQLPNLQSRVIIGSGQGPGLSSYAWGAHAGVERVTLTQANLPAHSHAAVFTPTGSGSGGAAVVQALTGAPVSSLSATPAAGSQLANTGPTGASQPKIYAPAGTSGTPVNLGGVSGGGGGITGGTVQIGNTGSNVPVETLPPYLALRTNICLSGLYPVQD
ncbi:phage tail protein [Rhodopseudomonas sp. WA056]|uniref:Tail Collar domain protein n=1 Tax=Rhodopseudomonas palustris (strain DX-1) TaxID=652103 RepID=E6VDI9_RHOPX|nr:MULTISPECIES: tail fiber protein [Rhodopseudomonas]NEW88481.1 phage tail protein [Rhodopseudomonas sp. WA056]QDM00173.1 phage tail protein [Rhodopseudomonas palustris]